MLGGFYGFNSVVFEVDTYAEAKGCGCWAWSLMALGGLYALRKIIHHYSADQLKLRREWKVVSEFGNIDIRAASRGD
ncbi:hypothetical protein [Prochlorococcus marinus]|uniref:Uncharacterized protein n=1 Tax=Prochlorococcus marinus (strain MIT 9211) TaxID=93059 RepID=A9B9N4_PROM4|nr:hypothetical protein [Prochlorococcus marinus]ABX08546.1 Hypothetical protein P9211_06151 [Prochlorococcus marinus str. MIT 9211]